MNEALEKLIHALREELEQYGEMLARLDQQQEFVTRRASEDLFQATAGIELQSQTMQATRRLRIEKLTTMARSLGLADDATFAEIIPHLPAHYRPLIAALIQENDESLGRIHRRLRQNHVLLCRSLESMRRLLGNLLPSSSNPVDTDKLSVSLAFCAPAMHQAAG